MKKVGSRVQVFRGKAMKTVSGLQKKDLKRNKRNKIVSKKVSKIASKQNHLGDRLQKRQSARLKKK